MPDTILVFSHLRWSFVYQRPQHLMTRLARRRRVIFFEEPDPHDSELYLEKTAPEPGVLVCRPTTPSNKPGYHDDQRPWLVSLLRQLIREEGVRDYVAWLYTPMALPLIESLDPSLVVYDCMDELSGFLKAPKQLVQREAELLRIADLVFTGGPSLYAAKRPHHPRVYCFPSSVDSAHFGRARTEGLDHRLQQGLPRPRLGYFGVLDERLDLPLLDALAASHPQWQIVLVGPVLKIDPGSLPRHPNLHYLGQQEYADLPDFVAGWDVCLMPFALNDATRFISPTKTLEYMAAEKPIVSSPIRDVAGPYGEIVLIGAGIASFIDSCERAVALPAAERAAMIDAMRRVVAGTSWDATVEAMEVLVSEAARRAPRRDTPVPGPLGDFK